MTSELDEMLMDPTLDSCCRRDLEDQKKAAQLKSKLLSLDRTDQRLRHADILLQSTQPQRVARSHAKELDANDDEDSDFGSEEEDHSSDPEVARLRQLRMEEMKRTARSDTLASSLGYGRVNDISWSLLVQKAQGTEGYCICHLSVEGHEVSI